ncbi:hypothetical protein [Lacticaseibacillus saniviri]|nr:hypothetical protein [Lacticaseibacillus saniviri]
MKIEEYDTVLLKDGRKAAIVEILDSSHFWQISAMVPRIGIRLKLP